MENTLNRHPPLKKPRFQPLSFRASSLPSPALHCTKAMGVSSWKQQLHSETWKQDSGHYTGVTAWVVSIKLWLCYHDYRVTACAIWLISIKIWLCYYVNGVIIKGYTILFWWEEWRLSDSVVNAARTFSFLHFLQIVVLNSLHFVINQKWAQKEKVTPVWIASDRIAIQGSTRMRVIPVRKHQRNLAINHQLPRRRRRRRRNCSRHRL